MAVGNPKSKNVSDRIDPRILRLLGLEDVFDLDYDTYLTLLKEAMVMGRMPKTKMATEEVEMLTDEYKRVKGKSGRFQVKTKNVNVKKKTGPVRVTNNKYILNQKNIISPQKLLPGGKEPQTAAETIKSAPGPSKLEENVAAIRKSVESIASILSNQLKFQKSVSERNRKDAEGRKRGGRESSLEKPLKAITKAVSSLLAPVKSIWDTILNFLIKTILGRIFYKLIDWFANPENAKKVTSIIRFLGDWWPALLGGYILFGTSFGGFVGSIIGIVSGGLLRLTRFAIPQLLKFIRTPLGAGIGLFAAGAAIPMLFPETVDEQERKSKKGPGSVEDKIAQLEEQKKTLNFLEKLQGKGAEIDEQIKFLRTGKTASYGFSGGGGVFGQKGTDKIPAMLTDGEFVISKGAVQKFGVPFFEALNSAGGGNNTPRSLGETVYAAGGGFIGSDAGSDRGPTKMDPVSELKKHFNNFLRSRGAGPNFDIGKPSTWKGGGGGTSTSGGGGSGGFLGGLGYLNRAAGQVPKMLGLDRLAGVPGEASKLVSPKLSYLQRIAGEASKVGSSKLSDLQRVFNEGKKLAAPTLNRAGKVVEGVKQKVGSTIDSIKNFDFSGLKTLGSNIHGAATEAVPALLASTLGISRTDKGVSQDMQRALLQAQRNAEKRGQKDVDYGDYEGGGLSAGGLTMGRIGNDEWKRDEKGRIIGLRQVYDTNRSAREAMQQAGENWEAFKKSGFKDMSSLGRVAYKPFEALLAKVQNRGMTMHDVNFDEKVLGFKPGKEVLNDTQRRMIKEQKNREALQDKRPWWDKMGLFGGASAEMEREKKKKLNDAKYYGPGGDPKGTGRGQAQRAKVNRPKPKRSAPPPPVAPKPTVVSSSKKKNKRGGGTTNANPKPPAVTAQNNKRQSNAKSSYGIKK